MPTRAWLDGRGDPDGSQCGEEGGMAVDEYLGQAGYFVADGRREGGRDVALADQDTAQSEVFACPLSRPVREQLLSRRARGRDSGGQLSGPRTEVGSAAGFGAVALLGGLTSCAQHPGDLAPGIGPLWLPEAGNGVGSSGVQLEAQRHEGG